MKTARTPNPSLDLEKRQKANLFEPAPPEAIEAMLQQSVQDEQNKILLRIDRRTHVLVHPKKATPEYAEELRKRYKLETPVKGGRGR